MGIIYIAVNMENGRSYIGQTYRSLEVRQKEHERHARNRNTNSVFHKAIRKYGLKSFEWITINIPDDDLDEAEEMLIQAYRHSGIRLYNLADGGGGSKGHAVSEEHIEALRLAMTGVPKSKQHRERLSKSRVGKFIGSDNSNAKPIILIHPTGEEEIFSCAKLACDKYNLCKSSLSLVANGKQDNHKGYKCKFTC